MNSVPADSQADEAFTLTEVLASLVLAGLLMVGLMELGGQCVRSGSRIASDLNEARSLRLLAAGMERAARALPEDIEVFDGGFDARVGAMRVRAQSRLPDDVGTLQVSIDHSGVQTGAWLVGRQAGALTFQLTDGLLEARALPAGDLVIRVELIRAAPHDCIYDPVVRQCQ